MKNRYFFHLLVVLLSLGLSARATTPPPASGRPLGEALNPDGTLRPGANGSFDARQFRMGTAPDGRPVFRPAGTTGAGDERWQDGFGLPNGVGGEVYAIAQRGTDVYVGGDFTIAGGVRADYVAKWNGTAWSSLGTGIANALVGTTAVYALAIAPNGDLYAGGNFTQAGGVAASNVAKWDGTAWSSLGTGMANGTYGSVKVLAVAPNGDVYAGGYFFRAGGLSMTGVAKWNGTVWSSLGSGLYGGIGERALALAIAPNGDVYVGGSFSLAGGVASNSIAKWDGTVWSSLGLGLYGGIGNDVLALAVASNGDLYAGGGFTHAGGVATNHVARWNGTTWSSLGTGAASGAAGPVRALAIGANGDVYVGGDFTQAGGVAASRVAKWNGTAWSSLDTGTANGVNDEAMALVIAANGDVYVGGKFLRGGGAAVSNMVRWNGTAWSSLGTGPGDGVNSAIKALAVAPNGDVYVGGEFTQAGGVAANYVARWNGTTWSSLGTGAANGVSGPVRALAIGANGDVYVGGQFFQAGGIAASCIAKWNGTAWSSLGTGVSYYIAYMTDVRALVIAANGDMYVGGMFQQAGGVAASNVAKWNGTAWSSLNTGLSPGLSHPVNAMVVAANGDVYAGGEFYGVQGGGLVADHIARWNGTAWNNLDTGVLINGPVQALAIAANGHVYINGNFTILLNRGNGGVVTRCVAKWDGAAWSSLGPSVAGLHGANNALAIAANGDVYVGGSLTQAGGGVARWDGTAWSSLGTGVSGEVYGLGIGPTGKLVAVGNFTRTGDGSKVMARFGIYDPNAPLATAAAKATPAGQLYPNPAHGTATLRLPATAPRLALTLTDALGRVVRRYPAPATAEAELDLRGLPAGTYVVRCGAFSQRLVVE